MPRTNRGSKDTLTGLLTRKVFEERLSEAVERAQVGEFILSLVFLDIDHFMRVNDVHGHGVGDAVIRRVAEVIQSTIPEDAISARYGGEEFVVLLPGLEREQAFLLAEQMRATTEAETDYGMEKPVKLGVRLSGGVSAFPTDGRTTSEILRKADQALYRAKGTGRNKVCIAEEERMAAKTSHFTLTQLARLSRLGKEEGVGEAVLLREALDDLLIKYKVSDIES